MMSARLLSNTLRLATKTVVRRATLQTASRVSIARFSTTPFKYNFATEELTKVIKSELEFEKNDSFGLDEVYSNYLKDSGFKVIDIEQNVLAELSKTTEENETVHIYFDVAKISQTGYEIKQIQEQMKEMEEEGESYMEDEIEQAAVVDINVVIEKNGKAVGYDLGLSMTSNEFTVGGITYFDDAAVALSDSSESAAKRDLKYSGPEFTNLAEELQSAMSTYLESRGVDAQLADFLIAFSSVKENNEYISWLDELAKFHQ